MLLENEEVSGAIKKYKSITEMWEYLVMLCAAEGCFRRLRDDVVTLTNQSKAIIRVVNSRPNCFDIV